MEPLPLGRRSHEAQYEHQDDCNDIERSLRGEVRNLLDEDYGYVLDNPMPGRSVFAGLRWEF